MAAPAPIDPRGRGREPANLGDAREYLARGVHEGTENIKIWLLDPAIDHGGHVILAIPDIFGEIDDGGDVGGDEAPVLQDHG
jgi:hypothetical protein